MPDAVWGAVAGLISGILGSTFARIISTPERREANLRQSYDLMMRRIQHLEHREQELDDKCQELEEKYEKLQREYDDLERRHFRMLRDYGGTGGK